MADEVTETMDFIKHFERESNRNLGNAEYAVIAAAKIQAMATVKAAKIQADAAKTAAEIVTEGFYQINS